ncbi:protein of unknown function (plasmid) [Azospirillum lipoferum 4B]|uniref:Uncharacterized protein n=1 Tax=Azospirillum lipoferum (strain 4B) TaxID=862719 RepID=G7ZIJ6_AZOL4|nr:protein of unknown function [Azospirillum lipoferum 4B]
MCTPTSPQPWTSVSCQVKAKFGIMTETPILGASRQSKRAPRGRKIPRRAGACQAERSGLDSSAARCYDSGGFS